MSPTPSPSTNVTPDSTPVDDPRAVARELDDVAVLGDHDRRGGHARIARELAWAASIRNSPWIGITRLRPDEAEQRAHLLGARVARDVHGRVLLVQHLRAAPREPVDRVVHAQLVPGHGSRGHDHGVAALDADGRMVVVGDPRQRRERLALGAGAEDQLARRGVEVVAASFGCTRSPRGRGRSRGCARCSGSSSSSGRSRRPCADLGGDVDRLLHAVDVRGERGDQDAAGALRE